MGSSRKGTRRRRKGEEGDPLAWGRLPWAREALDLWSRRFQGKLKNLDIGGNATWQVNTETERFVLRLYRPGRWSASQIEAEHDFLRFLGPSLNVGAPYKGRNHASLQEVAPRQYAAIFPWAEGKLAPLPPSAGMVETVGAYLGHLHTKSCGFRTRRQRQPLDKRILINRSLDVIEKLWRRHLPDQPVPDLRTAARHARKLWQEIRPFEGWLHGDMHWGNFKILEGDVQPFDFDDCGPGPFAYDVATVHYATKETWSDAIPMFPLLRGYNDVAPWILTAREVWLFIWVRHLFILRWILERPELFPGKSLLRTLESDLDQIRQVEGRLRWT